MKSRFFKLYRAYSISFSSLNIGNFGGSLILKDCIEVQGEKNKVVVLCSRFHVVVVQWRQRNVQKSVIHVPSCCFANLNSLLFCRSCWICRRRCLSPLLRIDRELREGIIDDVKTHGTWRHLCKKYSLTLIATNLRWHKTRGKRDVVGIVTFDLRVGLLPTNHTVIKLQLHTRVYEKTFDVNIKIAQTTQNSWNF